MTEAVHDELVRHLVRGDGQEDVCLATYRPSRGPLRNTALLGRCVLPRNGERLVHGNATVTGEYVLRAAELAREANTGLVLLHSHPRGRGWQAMSGPDRDTESAYANLVREATGLPLVGMTLAGADHGWSARHWDVGAGRAVACTPSTHVRVIGSRFQVTWDDTLVPPPRPSSNQVRTVSAWGDKVQADLARRKILVVGAGSVGMDVVLRLAASGVQHLTVMDFDVVEERNLDRLIGATRTDARLGRPKCEVALREALRAATAGQPSLRTSYLSVCEPQGFQECLDHDLIFCCVDRPWPRAVLNAVAYDHLIPVIDGGIAIWNLPDGRMRNASWRAHVLRPGRPCVACNRQVEMSDVQAEIQGDLDDPRYTSLSKRENGQNVAVLSGSVSAALLAQYVSFSVAPAGCGEPGPLQYHLAQHDLEKLDTSSREGCMYEPPEPRGIDSPLCGRHEVAERARANYRSTSKQRIAHWADHLWQSLRKMMRSGRGPRPMPENVT